ncbi:MAG: hypothetical protein JWM34_2258 [Ilumatobacteraceae bacterium]|nr:hypothetical protein [Ilumatobacteraceae bacterium]
MPWPAITAGAVVSVLVRLRAFWTPVTSDEGGFIAIARAWAHGDVLYRDVWVDRPQGLLAVFRFWDWISGGSTASVRIMAMIFGVIMVVGVGVATAVLVGRAAGGLAAVLVGIASASPAIEGHIANGELLSGALAAAGIAVTCLALQRRDRAWMLFVGGLLAGGALSIKQSGYEGLLAFGLWIVIAIAARWRSPREGLRALGLVVGGTAAVIAVLALHGALTGYSRWWYAFAGYRLDDRSAVKGADWQRFFMTARIARPTIWPLLALIAMGVVILVVTGIRRLRQPNRERGVRHTLPGTPVGSLCLLFLWPLAATVAFLTGGQFHRHYWVTLCPGLCALAGGLVARRLRASVAVTVALLALIPTYVNAAKIIDNTNREFVIEASGDNRPNTDEHLAAWFREHRQPGDEMYIMCASASFYADAREDPPFPYLWQDGVLMVPNALEDLRLLLASPTKAPRYMAIYESPSVCDPSGQLATVVTAHYAPFTTVDGVWIWKDLSRT